MNFYRVKSNATLHEFNDPIGKCPILGRDLNVIQEELITNVGGKLMDVDSEENIHDTHCFIFSEDLYFSKQFLKKAIDAAKDSKSSLQYLFSRNTFNQRYVLPCSLDTDKHHVFNFQFRSVLEIKPHIIEQEVFENSMRLPRQIVSGENYSMDQCATYAIHLISPFHLMFANLAMNLERTIQYQNKIPDFIKKRFNSIKGKWYFRGLKQMNRIGKNCVIHPTAIVEGSVIGDGVRIGANTIVRLSTVQNNCYISDNVSVMHSVLGEGTFIANSNYINSCLTYKDVFLIHGPYQLSIFGENSACFAVINCDIRLDQKNIKIPTSEGVMDSAQPLLGIAYGHRSKTGGGNIIAAGRIVPNDLHINPPDNIILNFDKWK